MKRVQLLATVLCMVPCIAVNAQQPPQPIQQTRGVSQFGPQIRDAVAEAYAQQHMSQTSYGGQVTQGMPSQTQYGNGASNPANYYGGGYCQGYGSDLSCYPRHNYTYGYQRPRHLVYPQPQAAGGAVVYPYYTHKGPSDFFRK